MAENMLRVGIIGMGYFATDHISNFRKTRRAEIVAASRRDAQRLALAQRELDIPQTFTDWREMLEKTHLDAVVVSTPHNYHLEPTLAALDRGLHVLLEKPLATSIADALTIQKAVQHSDRVVMMGANRRGEPSWQAMKHALASGQIGQIRQISGRLNADMRVIRGEIPFAQPILQSLEGSEMMKTYLLDLVKPNHWRNDPNQMGGDFFTDICSHLVDVMLWMAEAPAVQVSAFSPKDRPHGAGIMNVQALLSNDVILSITFNDNVAYGDEFSFGGDGHISVLGDGGWVNAKLPGFGGGPAENIVIMQNGIEQHLPVTGQKTTPAEAFVSAVLDGAPNIAPVNDAANVVALIQSAYRSVFEGRVVRIER